MWAVFLLTGTALASYLIHRVEQVESQEFASLAQPCWSEKEDQVAYLSRPPEAKGWELWRVEREPKRVCSLDPGQWTLLGWLDNDQRLLLQPRQQEPPRVTVVEVQGGKRRDILFANKGIQFVGVRSGQVFFQRLEKADHFGQSLSLLRWEAGQDTLQKLLTIPFETESLHIEKVWPSLDRRWLALVIKMGSGNDRTLWLYNQEEDRLNWSGIRLSCQGMRGAWASDSTGLVVAVQLQHACDLYAFWNIGNRQYARLSAGQESHAYQPFWPRDSKHFLLLERKRVYKFDPEALQATQLTAQNWDRLRSRDLAVSPRGTAAAYIGYEDDDDQLYRVDFKGNYTEPLLPVHPKTLQRKSWWYLTGQAFRTALTSWFPLGASEGGS